VTHSVRWQEVRRVSLVVALAMGLVGCTGTIESVKTFYSEGREAQQNYVAGKTLYDAGDYVGAIPHFQRTLALDPKYDDAKVYLAWTYYHLNNYPEATRLFREVVARQPRWEGAWNGLGWSRYRAGQYNLAIEPFQEAVGLDPRYRDATVGLAYALFELGRYSEALPHLARLTREGEGFVFQSPTGDVEEVRSRYAWCLYYVGQYEKARVEFVRGLRAHPEWAGLHSGLGWTYLKLGDLAQARASFQRALQLQPDYPDARAGLAEASR
jgi:tetratricopeptide (TPR) repeat protein